MNEIIKKLNTLTQIILKDKKESLYFIGLVQRTDSENKWDILIIADWIKENNNYIDLEYIISNLKEIFNDDLNFLEDVVLYKSDHYVASDLKKATIDNEIILGKNNKLQLWEDGFINVVPVYSVLEELTIKEKGIKTPVSISDF